jgi:hypothetical protein
MKIHDIQPGQQALIAGVRNDGTLFTFGSVQDYARRANMSVAVAVEKALMKGWELAYAIPEGVMIADDPRVHEDWKKRVAAAASLAAGDLVRIEGRVYELAPAANRNVELKPIAECTCGEGYSEGQAHCSGCPRDVRDKWVKFVDEDGRPDSLVPACPFTEWTMENADDEDVQAAAPRVLAGEVVWFGGGAAARIGVRLAKW